MIESLTSQNKITFHQCREILGNRFWGFLQDSLHVFYIIMHLETHFSIETMLSNALSSSTFEHKSQTTWLRSLSGRQGVDCRQLNHGYRFARC